MIQEVLVSMAMIPSSGYCCFNYQEPKEGTRHKELKIQRCIGMVTLSNKTKP